MSKLRPIWGLTLVRFIISCGKYVELMTFVQMARFPIRMVYGRYDRYRKTSLANSVVFYDYHDRYSAKQMLKNTWSISRRCIFWYGYHCNDYFKVPQSLETGFHKVATMATMATVVETELKRSLPQ